MIDFIIANSADPDEMWHSVAFHLGLLCLQKYLLAYAKFRLSKILAKWRNHSVVY